LRNWLVPGGNKSASLAFDKPYVYGISGAGSEPSPPTKNSRPTRFFIGHN
jgi:hypothetical protein